MPPRKKSLIDFGVSLKDVGVDYTPDMAKTLVGFEEVDKSKAQVKLQGPSGPIYAVLRNNDSNRPLSLSLAKQYGSQMLRGQWAGQWNSPANNGNGESLTVDTKGKVVSAVHRSMGLIIADLERQSLEALGEEGLERLAEYGVKKGKPITLPGTVIVTDIPAPAADTTDIGKNRTLGDVLFRRHEFKDGDLKESVIAKLSRELAVALRLVWLRMRGERVAAGSKLHHPEAVAFLEKHPLLHDAILHVYNENGGSGKDGGRISDYISLGYAAGMMYLAAYSGSDRGKMETGQLDMTRKPKNWGSAEKMWTCFAQFSISGMVAKEAPAVAALHSLLVKNKGSEDKYSRDALCVLCTRSWLSWMQEEDKWGSTRSLATKLYVKEDDKQVLDFIRFGGFDLDREVLVDKGWLVEGEVEVTKAGDWKIGDTCWVMIENYDEVPWFGEIVGFAVEEGVTYATVESKEEGAEGAWNAPLKDLYLEAPEVEEEEEEEVEVEEEAEEVEEEEDETDVG